ncbi:MAG: MoxR family ATPase, partial [Desulfuromonadales bacterium]|nr:MoxR family ATPase [Desulfuromonadales bacterium]
ATQNPIEFEGTYPLPEAQKDRFMLKINMREPGPEEEIDLAKKMLTNETPEQVLASDTIKPLIKGEHLPAIRAAMQGITIKDELIQYIVNIIRNTRQNPSILVGGGPRATQALLLGSRAMAVLSGRDFVTPEDIKKLAVPVLEHRLVIRPEYEIEGVTAAEIVDSLLQEVAVPR